MRQRAASTPGRTRVDALLRARKIPLAPTSRLAFVVLIAILALAAALAVTSHVIYDRNENRLLNFVSRSSGSC